MIQTPTPAPTAPLPPGPLVLDELLAKLRASDRSAAMHHLTACRAEDDPRHADLWERLLCTLLKLAPELPRLGGRQSAQFFIPDGKYKIQVFALRDTRNGQVHVYCRDTLGEGRAEGLVGTSPSGTGDALRCTADAGQSVPIEMLDGSAMSEPEAHLRPMLGWGRRVMHLTPPITATEGAIAAVEAICSLSAAKWAVPV